MNLIFRPAQINDLPEIVSIYNSTVPLRNVTADTEPVSVESKLNWFNQHSDKRPLLIITDNNKIIAWLNFHSFYGRPAYSKTVEIGIYIHADYRSKGIGQIILQKAIDLAPELEIENLLGYIFGNNESSIRLFKKNGFTIWGELPEVAEIDQKKIDLLIFGKKL